MGDANIQSDNPQFFSAFVSYSHADRKEAKKLHRKLESYRLPQHVAKQIAEHQPLIGLGHIFRDREDLPAAEDLSEAVKTALTMSKALVVVCSPDAKASPWVLREIELFQELHPERPILAALLRGEPEDAFPEPLQQGKEPLAADFRNQGDGPRLGFLKVVAGIAGVPLDMLVQRDAQRRLRSVMTITGGTVAAALAMMIMTFVAIQARNEAMHQQAEAEGLVEFMLTDLRRDLNRVQKLDLMTTVNERAMDYYRSQGDLSNLSTESLERRALVLRNMAEDDKQKGEMALAEEKLLEAYRTTAAILTSQPKNPDRMINHLESENALGFLANDNGDFSDAPERYDRSKKLADNLLRINKGNPRWVRESTSAHNIICSAYLLQKKETEKALSICRLAISQGRQLVDLEPQNREAKLELAVYNAWMADALLANGQTDAGFALHQQHLELVENLAASFPKDRHLQEQLAYSYYGVAKIFKDHQRRDLAAEYILKANAQLHPLLDHDENNSRWKELSEKIEKLMK